MFHSSTCVRFIFLSIKSTNVIIICRYCRDFFFVRLAKDTNRFTGMKDVMEDLNLQERTYLASLIKLYMNRFTHKSFVGAIRPDI